ncbi:DUF6056 family protein [Eubacterium callanderi]|uniref:DUF6056 family protein n=1 Tax=Eubacterium callanderi TaxID=53442 RepID=UPI00399C11A0
MSIKSLKANKKIKEVFPFFMLFIFMFVLHLATPALQNDDLTFRNYIENQSILSFLIQRYKTWSSRVLIEAVLVGMVSMNHLIWCLLDSLVVVLLAWSIAKLFFEKSGYSNALNWIIVSLILIYPFYLLSSAGWVATTLNYLWPLSFGLASFIPIKKYFENKKINIFESFLYSLLVIFAANNEQMAIIIFVIYAVFAIYFFMQKKRVSLYLLFNLFLTIISLLFILSCPGNDNRAIAEAQRFPGYDGLNIVQKILAGFLPTTTFFFEGYNLEYLIFVCLILVCIWLKYKDKVHRMIGALPLLVYTFWLVGFEVVVAIKPDLLIYSPVQYIKSIASFENLTFYLYSIMNALIVLLLVLCLFFIFRKKGEFLLVLLILGVGLASRITMGFSPTLFLSEFRTYLFFVFAIFIICVLLFDELSKFMSSDQFKYIVYIMIFIGVVSYFNTSLSGVIAGVMTISY